MSSIFSKIIAGAIPCYKVAETDEYLAFLDINPVVKGHTLCIPKKEVDYIFDLDAATLSGLMLFSQQVAKALDKTIACKRVGVLVVGTEVPHAHVHLMPFQQERQLSFANPRLAFSSAEMAEIARSIGKNVV